MPFIFSFFVFIFGLIIGSFLNVVILRLEKKETLGGRSYCPHCQHQLTWLDLIPVFSFIFLRGQCRYCKARISWQYPAVEISTAAIFLLIFNLKFEILNQFEIFKYLNILFLLYVASVLVVIFVYDFKHFLIPDKILFPTIIVTFLYRTFKFLNFGHWNLFRIWDLGFGISAPLISYLVAALIASGFFLSIFLISKGQWLGFGDVKLAILLGLILGFPNILVSLFLSFFFGAIIGVGLMILKKGDLKTEVPFAPFLIAGTFVAMLWGSQIIDWYFHFLVF